MTRRLLAAVLLAASMPFVFAAAASAGPDCPKNTVTINTQGKVITAPAQSQVCDNDPFTNDGLLGNLPVVGNLPSLGGIY